MSLYPRSKKRSLKPALQERAFAAKCRWRVAGIWHLNHTYVQRKYSARSAGWWDCYILAARLEHQSSSGISLESVSPCSQSDGRHLRPCGNEHKAPARVWWEKTHVPGGAVPIPSAQVIAIPDFWNSLLPFCVISLPTASTASTAHSPSWPRTQATAGRAHDGHESELRC